MKRFETFWSIVILVICLATTITTFLVTMFVVLPAIPGAIDATGHLPFWSFAIFLASIPVGGALGIALAAPLVRRFMSPETVAAQRAALPPGWAWLFDRLGGKAWFTTPTQGADDE